MKLYDLIPTQQNISEELMSYSSQGEWMEKAVDTYNKKGIDPLLRYIADTKYNGKVDMTQFKQDFMSDRNDFKSQDEHVEEFLHFFDQLPEGKDKPKQNNPVAKHSRNMAGAGAHKSAKDYDRKNAKKDIKKELEEGEERSDIRDLMIVKVKDYLQTKSPGSYISLEDMESDLYDYASQLDHDDLDSPEELRDFMHNPGEEASSAVTELLSGMYHSEFDDYITSDPDYVDNRNMGHPDGYSSSEEDQPDRIREESNKMIGKPDNFYDAEQRQEAYNDLQDALQGNYMDDYIKDGSCPACAGSGYMDGEDEVYNDETEEYEEGSECDGFGNYGCDEGEMTQNDDGLPNWAEIAKHDERQVEKANRGPAPSKEQIMKLLPRLHDEYVKSGRFNAMELPGILRQMYPELSKREAAGYTAEFFKTFNEQAMPKSKREKEQAKNSATGEFTPDDVHYAMMKRVKAYDKTKKDKVSEDSGEATVAKMLAKALGDENRWTEMSAIELYAELESTNPEVADMISKVAKMLYDVKLQERVYKDVGVADTVKDQRGKEFQFDKGSKKFKSQDGEEADVSTKLGKDLMRLRKNHMKRTSPSYPNKHSK